MDARQAVALEDAGSTPVLLIGRNYVLKGNEIMSETPDESVEREEKPCPDCGKTWYSWVPHSCYPVSDINKVEPNRFDPYEALDSIQAAGLEFHDAVKLEKPFKLITVQVLALRAYITGMER